MRGTTTLCVRELQSRYRACGRGCQAQDKTFFIPIREVSVRNHSDNLKNIGIIIRLLYMAWFVKHQIEGFVIRMHYSECPFTNCLNLAYIASKHICDQLYISLFFSSIVSHLRIRTCTPYRVGFDTLSKPFDKIPVALAGFFKAGT